MKFVTLGKVNIPANSITYANPLHDESGTDNPYESSSSPASIRRLVINGTVKPSKFYLRNCTQWSNA